MVNFLLLVFLIISGWGCSHSSKIKNHHSVVYTDYGADAYQEQNWQNYLDLLKSLGLQQVSLLFTCHVPDKSSHVIDCDSNNSPSIDRLGQLLQQAKSQGLSTSLRVYVDLLTGDWRAYWNPEDKKKTLERLTAQLVRFAKLSQDRQVDLFIIGAEYESLTQPKYEGDWRKLIKKLRNHYDGPISYGANSNYSDYKITEVEWVPFWDALDFVGVDYYHPMPKESTEPSGWVAEHRLKLKQVLGKLSSSQPLFINEVGAPAAAKGHLAPYQWVWPNTEINHGLQLQYLTTFMEVLNEYKIKGVHVWRFMPGEAKVYPAGYILQNNSFKRGLKQSYQLLVRDVGGN
jgi:hypothetical protein